MAFGIVVALVVGFAAAHVAGAQVYSGEPINIELEGADLELVLANFSELTGYVFAIDPQTASRVSLDQVVDALYEETPWDQVIDEVLSEAGLEWTLEGKVLWIHIPGTGPSGDRNFTGDEIRLRLKDADVRDVLATFSKITGHTIELAPEVQGTVSLRLDSVPWDQVLDFILTINGLASEFDGDIMSVYPVTDARGRQLIAPPS